MKIPPSGVGGWARELITQCETSRKERISACSTWKSYYNAGSDKPTPATFNKVNAHIEEVASYLYSPVDVRFGIEFDKSKGDDVIRMGDGAASLLSRDFHRRGGDIEFSSAVTWGLVKGCTFVKQVWGHSGIDYVVVQPEMMGMMNEAIPFENQEAFFHSTYLTPSQVDRMLTGRADRDEVLAGIAAVSGTSNADPARDDMFKQIIIGGIQPVATSPVNNPAGGLIRWMNGPNPNLGPKIMESLIRFDELWVIDDDRQDWTTIQLVGDGDAVFEGRYQRRNLCNVPGHHPFRQVCPNPVAGYAWGRSEVVNLFLLQDSINRRLDGIEAMMRKQEDPPQLATGISGMTDARWSVHNKPGGLITEENPNAKMQSLAPNMPQEIWVDLDKLIGFFDDQGGIKGVLSGRGEPGVRAGTHAETLVRTASPRIRDRALLVERQLEDVGDLHLRIRAAQDPTAFTVRKRGGGLMGSLMGMLGGKGGGDAQEFLLSQLPEDFHVVVDSHSASPAFVHDAEMLAFQLAKAGAITPADLLRLTPVQHKDKFIAQAEEREEAQAALLKEHPELIGKHGKR